MIYHTSDALVRGRVVSVDVQVQECMDPFISFEIQAGQLTVTDSITLNERGASRGRHVLWMIAGLDLTREGYVHQIPDRVGNVIRRESGAGRTFDVLVRIVVEDDVARLEVPYEGYPEDPN